MDYLRKIKRLFMATYAKVRTRKWSRYLQDDVSKNILNALIDDKKFADGRIGGGGTLKYNINRGCTFEIPELQEFSDSDCDLLVLKYKERIYNEYTRLLLDNSMWRGKYKFIDETSLSNVSDKDIVCYSCKNTPAFLNNIGVGSSYANNKIRLHQIRHGATFFGNTGKQYLDFFKPYDRETIIDLGSYDGNTDVEFLEWCKNSKIYAFEPIPANYKNIEDNILRRKLEGQVFLIKKAAGDTDTEVYFSENGDSSQIMFDSNEHSVRVSQTKIDTVIDEKITFIKMDIEGSELRALKGAKNTIKKCKPRLAICIYHRMSDLYDIPNYILSLEPNYRFAIRHYRFK